MQDKSCGYSKLQRMKWNKAVLLLGSNMGSRAHHIMSACNYLDTFAGDIVKSSSFYETSAWGKTDQESFLNLAVVLLTPYPPQLLITKILSIEKMMGRKREEKYGPRTIDIDIILFEKKIVRSENLVLPHPEMQNRRFVLSPLVELVPNFLHPVFNKSMRTLLEECDDNLTVKRL